MLKKIGGFISTTRTRFMIACVAVVSSVMVMPAIAAATETEGEKKAGEKITEAAGHVSSAGENYILLVLTALVGLIALVIILPKAVGFIRRFI